MGADIIHPALLLDPRAPTASSETGSDDFSPQELAELAKSHANRVLIGCDEGMRHYMSTVGIGALTAYRGGSHVWQAETLNNEIAALMGLQQPRFSGIGFGRFAKWLQAQWRFPTSEGPGLCVFPLQHASYLKSNCALLSLSHDSCFCIADTTTTDSVRQCPSGQVSIHAPSGACQQV